jgi:hypothetical protein
MSDIKYPNGKHPNSLKNLKGPWDSEGAKKAQVLGVAKRKANKAARDAMKLNMKDWNLYKSEVLDDQGLSAVDVLKVLMYKALEAEEYDTASDLAKSLAEFETPKLARVENTNQEVSGEEMTDEELQERIKAALSVD